MEYGRKDLPREAVEKEVDYHFGAAASWVYGDCSWVKQVRQRETERCH